MLILNNLQKDHYEDIWYLTANVCNVHLRVATYDENLKLGTYFIVDDWGIITNQKQIMVNSYEDFLDILSLHYDTSNVSRSLKDIKEEKVSHFGLLTTLAILAAFCWFCLIYFWK